MILKRKILLLFVLAALSGPAFAQIAPPPPRPSKEQVKAEKEAKEKAEKAAKEKAEADAKAKAKQSADLKKLLEQQSKGESSNAKMSQTAEAAVLAKADAFYSAAMSQINSKHIAWIKQNAKKIYFDKMDELAFKVMARYYGKNEGLSEQDIEALQVLLLRETYLIADKQFDNLLNHSKGNLNKVICLAKADKMLSDSSYQHSVEELDSINLLINNSVAAEMESRNNQSGLDKNDSLEMAARKKPDNTTAVSNLSLTKTKLTESIENLSKVNREQLQHMNEIAQRQQKITLMLSKMVNQVTEHQEKIIQNLK